MENQKVLIIGDSSGKENLCIRLDLICSFFRNNQDRDLTDIIFIGGGRITIEIEFKVFLNALRDNLDMYKLYTTSEVPHSFSQG